MHIKYFLYNSSIKFKYYAISVYTQKFVFDVYITVRTILLRNEWWENPFAEQSAYKGLWNVLYKSIKGT